MAADLEEEYAPVMTTKDLWFVTATWPLPVAPDVRPGAVRVKAGKSPFVCTLRPGGKLKSHTTGQFFMLPLREEHKEGATVYRHVLGDLWRGLPSGEIGFSTRKKAEDAAFQVVMARPHWIGKLSVVKIAVKVSR